MGKREIARNERFLLYPQCFLLNQIIVSPFVHIFDIISLFATELEDPKRKRVLKPFPKQALVFTYLQYEFSENTVGKGEIACNEQFLPFPQCFLPFRKNLPPFSSTSKLSSANSFSLEVCKICRLGMG